MPVAAVKVKVVCMTDDPSAISLTAVQLMSLPLAPVKVPELVTSSSPLRAAAPVTVVEREKAPPSLPGSAMLEYWKMTSSAWTTSPLASRSAVMRPSTASPPPVDVDRPVADRAAGRSLSIVTCAATGAASASSSPAATTRSSTDTPSLTTEAS